MKKKILIIIVLCICFLGLWILQSSKKDGKTAEPTTAEQDNASSDQTEDSSPKGMTIDEDAGFEVEEDSGYIIVN